MTVPLNTSEPNNTSSILAMLKQLRYLNTKGCDRTIDLINYCKNPSIDAKTLQEMQLININKNANKLNSLLGRIEVQLMKSCGFNFAVYNIPSHANDQTTDEITPTNYENIRATLEQFGKVDQLKIIRGTVYTKFHNKSVCNQTHSTINNMQLGNNIITTMVV